MNNCYCGFPQGQRYESAHIHFVTKLTFTASNCHNKLTVHSILFADDILRTPERSRNKSKQTRPLKSRQRNSTPLSQKFRMLRDARKKRKTNSTSSRSLFLPTDGNKSSDEDRSFEANFSPISSPQNVSVCSGMNMFININMLTKKAAD